MFDKIYEELYAIVRRGTDCEIIPHYMANPYIDIYLQSPTRKISKLVYLKMAELGYSKDWEYERSTYFVGEDLPDIQIVLPKKFAKTT